MGKTRGEAADANDVPFGTIVYVHGANTGTEGFEREQTAIRSGLRRLGWEDTVNLVMVPWRREVDMHPGDWKSSIPDTHFRFRLPRWRSFVLMSVYGAVVVALFLVLVTVASPEVAFLFGGLAFALQLVLIAITYPWMRDLLRMRQRRANVISMLGPRLLSDVLSYNRCRGEIFRMVDAKRREALNRRLASGEAPPIVMMGLSLGGIILVDYLADPVTNKEGVGALLTVGSQAPLLYTFDALEGIRHPPKDEQPAGKPFTPWINVYNPADHLSFVAAPVFRVEGIEDRQVGGREDFPDAHSAYWRNDTTWVAVRDALEAARLTLQPEA